MRREREERDSLGPVRVPAHAYWGAVTERARQNFDISGKGLPERFIIALARVKRACALANMELGRLDPELGQAILEALDEIIEERKLLSQFPVDIYQSGSGTQTNMNMNEVVANRANEILGQPLGTKSPVHPNDHVNMSQSSNDVIPTAMHLCALEMLSDDLIPGAEHLIHVLEKKIEEFQGIVKVGRTHLQDAVPIPLAMEFRVYHHHVLSALAGIQHVRDDLSVLPIGGTALGTGLNAPEDFGETVVRHLEKETGLPLRASGLRAEAIASHNVFARLGGALRSLALALLKMANDIRLMASGPRAGLAELVLPENEPGSSIMPGKVNPTQAEMLAQVCLRVMANDLCISLGEGVLSNLDLNVAKPLIITAIIESLHILSNAMVSFAERCLNGLKPNTERIEQTLDQDLMIVTRLAPVIGYDKAAEIAQEALRSGHSVRKVVEEMGLEVEGLDELLDPRKMV